VFDFSHDGKVKAVGHGLVSRRQITAAIATAYQLCRAFIEVRQQGLTRQNVVNAVWALFDDALAVGEGM